MNYRVNLANPKLHPDRDKDMYLQAMNREEEDTDAPFPEELLYGPDNDTAMLVSLIATSRTWGLVIRQETPAIEAINQLMNIRYFQSSDDIPHDEIFSPLMT